MAAERGDDGDNGTEPLRCDSFNLCVRDRLSALEDSWNSYQLWHGMCDFDGHVFFSTSSTSPSSSLPPVLRCALLCCVRLHAIFVDVAEESVTTFGISAFFLASLHFVSFERFLSSLTGFLSLVSFASLDAAAFMLV